MDPKLQGTFRFLAATKIKQILNAGTYHRLHKRYQHNINQIKDILNENNLTVTKADKNKAMVIINKDALEQKIQTFIQENQITCLKKDPTEIYQKQLQQALLKCNTLIEKNKHRYLINIKPRAPSLNAHIKTHKEGQPIRPVINNTQAPSYKIAKFLNKKLQNLTNLPNSFIAKNSQEVAHDLRNIQIRDNNRLLSLDIKDLYVNLPIKNILYTTEFWLKKQNHDQTTTGQTLYLLEAIMRQNYFQHDKQFYQRNKGIAMDSPISSTLAEIYLQHLEETHETLSGTKKNNILQKVCG
jgi:hypothetical protein